ncbi:F-box domain containing protein [Pandoravirus celtis]|uniref:F-box domain containing protein n=1 Tax=Pandoravirus celtis TaxID=2568002 RepID=A0A4D6EIK8_9VIRU|nr:F-box domain containing protein [Pandoravirus celtis]
MEVDEPTHATDLVEPSTQLPLNDLPVEILANIVGWLPGHALAAAACTCRALAALADDERLWKAAYRRDIDPCGPPLEHSDHAVYGMSARWIYGLMRAEPGRLRMDPSGRLAGRIVASDGKQRKAGQFAPSIEADGKVALLPDGYNAMVTQYDNDDGRYYAAEGRFTLDKQGKINGVATHRHRVEFDAAKHVSRCEGTYRGPIAHGNYAGIGTMDYADGTSHTAEFDSVAITGRCVSTRLAPAGAVYSGQCDNGHQVGYGVVRYADGATSIFCPNNGNDAVLRVKRPAPDAAPLSRLTKRVARKGAPGNAVALTVVHDREAVNPGAVPSVMATRAGSSLVRVTHHGHVAVGDGNRLAFVAVSDLHPDPSLAGRRFRDNCPAARALLGLAHGEPPSFVALDRLHNGSPDAIRDILDNNIAMGGNGVQVGDRGVGLPFGVVIDGGAPCRGSEVNTRDPTGDAWRVRCFLTGLCVPAAECVMGHGGRFYHATMLSWWLALCDSADDDRPDHPNGWEPETGASTCGSGLARIMWEPWMASVPPRVISLCGVRVVRSMSASAWARGHVCQRAAQDLVRLSVLTMTKAASLSPCLDTPRGVEILVAATATIAESSAMAGECPPSLSSLSPLLRSFDMVILGHVELVHPTWDPRGPWLYGPHTMAIDDPTLAQYERWTCADPPDRDLAAHGILRIALDRASFVGARFTGVFFFGQRFGEASFVGATLDRCVFVGCVFSGDCLVAGTTVLDCDLCDCTHVTPDGRLTPFTLKDLLKSSKRGFIN